VAVPGIPAIAVRMAAGMAVIIQIMALAVSA